MADSGVGSFLACLGGTGVGSKATVAAGIAWLGKNADPDFFSHTTDDTLRMSGAFGCQHGHDHQEKRLDPLHKFSGLRPRGSVASAGRVMLGAEDSANRSPHL
ncbi:hypothetical protein ACTMU2_05140 [Cupriavidus basilensis]